MLTREDLLKDPDYWFEGEQNELFRQVSEYMERENINQTELAKRLKVSKGYISQILNGNFNYTLKKHIELCLSIGLVPKISYKSIVDVIKEDKQVKDFYNKESTIISIGAFGGMHLKPIGGSNFAISEDYTVLSHELKSA